MRPVALSVVIGSGLKKPEATTAFETGLPVPSSVIAMMSLPWEYSVTRTLFCSLEPKTLDLYSTLPSAERWMPRLRSGWRQLLLGCVPTGYSLTWNGSAPEVGLPPLRRNSLRVGFGWP